MKLGAEPIVALTDANKRAKLCNAHYTTMKQKLLYEHPWKFAIKRIELEAESDAPVFGFSHKFSLPFDYLRAIYEVNGRFGVDEIPADWQREGSYLLTNSPDNDDQGTPTDSSDDVSVIKMRYIADVEEELFSPSFAEALSMHLAYELAYALVQSAAYRDQLKNDMRQALQEARSFNAQEGVAQRVTDEEFLNVRL